MIDFKNKDELPTNVVILGSLIVIVVAGACLKLLQPPQAPPPSQTRAARDKINHTTEALKKHIVDARLKLAAMSWQGQPEDIGPVALKQVNALVQNRHLKLVGFHAQKAIEQPNVTLIPFTINVDGGFPNVMAFTHDLEKSGTKFVVNIFQVSNADQSSDKVTANIGITAYQVPQPTVAPSATAPAAPIKTVKGAKKNA